MLRPFSEILDIYNGRNQKKVENPNGKYPIYGSGGIMGYADDFICPNNTVLIGRKGSINNPIFVDTPLWNVDTAFGLIAKQGVLLPKYLYYFCVHFDFEKLNTTVTIPSLTKANLLKIQMPVPDVSDQQIIVSTLDTLQSIIAHRKQQLVKLDELVKARFVEMFGDPVSNPFGFKSEPLGSIIKSIEVGWSGNGKQRERRDGEIAVLKVSAVTKGYFIPEECKVLDDQTNIKKYVFPQKGDLIFSRANTREMVGATAVIKQDYPYLILPDKLWKIRFDEYIEVDYIKQVLSAQSVRNLFSAASTGTSGSMYNVSMEKLKSIIVPLPSHELQMAFSAFVEQTDKSKVAVQKALDEAQMLFDSLMQEYFG